MMFSVAPGDVTLFTFSDRLIEVPPRRRMAGVDAIVRSQPHGGTQLGAALAEIHKVPHDRLIVVTDEQSHDRVTDPVARNAYMSTSRPTGTALAMAAGPHRWVLRGRHP